MSDMLTAVFSDIALSVAESLLVNFAINMFYSIYSESLQIYNGVDSSLNAISSARAFIKV